jgi:hypothetical protein
MRDDQITIREVSPGRWTLEFEFNSDFIAYLKQRVPCHERSYDPETHIWTINDDGYRLNAVEGIAVQKFRHAVRQYRNAEGKLTLRNLKTGAETVQEELFT